MNGAQLYQNIGGFLKSDSIKGTFLICQPLNLLGQWLNFKLLGITYLVGKIKFKLLFQGCIR